MSGIEGAIVLNDGTRIPYYVFEGYDSKNAILQVLDMNKITVPIYLLYFFNMWYICGFDGWRGFILGKEDIRYINLDSHWVGKKIKNGNISLDLFPTEFAVPTFMGEQLFLEFSKTKANPCLFWKVNDTLSRYSNCVEMRKTISLFLTQFFPNAWFLAHTMAFTLKGWFIDDLIKELESSYNYGIWMVNPFTWRVKTGPLSAPYYASYYDFIGNYPKASFPMNGYGKKKK